jgi:hypothetical protein
MDYDKNNKEQTVLKCYKCKRGIYIYERVQKFQPFSNLSNSIFIHNYCFNCSDKNAILVRIDNSLDNNRYMKLVDLHNKLFKISNINIFKDLEKFANWVSKVKIGEQGYQYLKSNNYIK